MRWALAAVIAMICTSAEAQYYGQARYGYNYNYGYNVQFGQPDPVQSVWSAQAARLVQLNQQMATGTQRPYTSTQYPYGPYGQQAPQRVQVEFPRTPPWWWNNRR